MKRYHVHREGGKFSAPGTPAIDTPTVKSYWLDGKLHRPDGPAVVSKHGTRLYYWRGVRVPKHVIENPRATTVDKILNTSNIEVRRAHLETYGLEDALIDLGKQGKAKVINQTKSPRRRLWEISAYQDVDDQYPRYVEVDCPSTDRKYFLRVPPTMKTAAEAVAWTFSIEEEAYAAMTVET